MKCPEDILFEEWMRARRIRDTLPNKGVALYHAFYPLADNIQHLLQDFSPYGHRLVWGSEHAPKRLDTSNIGRDLCRICGEDRNNGGQIIRGGHDCTGSQRK